jgi:tRNA-Thr(GGU) m(6)t(6)A37 methyltransferase TsaA
MDTIDFELHPIGAVESPLSDPASAPLQGDEGGPDAWLAIEPGYAEALTGLEPGAEVIVLTWLHRADREALRVHPRGDPHNPIRGVFSTRSQDRPNPIGLHRVKVLEIDGTRVRVSDLEAIDGTPVVDVKVALGRER